MITSEIQLRPMMAEDWKAVAEIYEQGIKTGNATFQEETPTWDEWDAGHLKTCRIVALKNNAIVGWAALSRVSGRCVYAGVAEVSIYISENHRGHKIGTALLKKLIVISEEENTWTLQAGIFPENHASIKIHINLGFRMVGIRERIGKMKNSWRDTVLLEKRSHVIGIG